MTANESAPGRLAVVGVGPGSPSLRSPEATQRLAAASDLVGYGPYLDLVTDAPVDLDQRRHRFDNRQEAERARFALDLAAAGRDVVVVSSGDPGVFAMAAAVVEELERATDDRSQHVEVTIVPGVTAAQAAAARVGAPLGNDWCSISLSDNLKPWNVVEARLSAAASADFTVALYNPVSRHRPWQLARALEILAEHRSADTPVVVARDVARPGEAVSIVRLDEVQGCAIDMRTVLLVGSSTTRSFRTSAGSEWVYTPRAYTPVEVASG